jgi:hypothetical protein
MARWNDAGQHQLAYLEIMQVLVRTTSLCVKLATLALHMPQVSLHDSDRGSKRFRGGNYASSYLDCKSLIERPSSVPSV